MTKTSVYASNDSTMHRATCGRDGEPCPTGEHGTAHAKTLSTQTLPNGTVVHTAESDGAKIQLSYCGVWAYDITYLGKHVHSGTAGTLPRATAALATAICDTLHAGRLRSKRAYDAVQSLAVHTRND